MPADARAEVLELEDLPDEVTAVLARLLEAGHQAALVGGSVRDLLADSARADRAANARPTSPGDWDVATSARPQQVVRLFAGAAWNNRFGTVTVRSSTLRVEITTFRSESGYSDRRRPDRVRWGSSLEGDLGRRDFTINAMAWVPSGARSRRGTLVDPYGGRRDLAAGLLRTVGDPNARLEEDALRLVRAVRFVTRFGLALDPAARVAIERNAATAADLSGERVRDELLRILGATGGGPPSAAFRLMEELGLLGVLLPELAALRGVPQAKAIAGDALDHSLRTADALPAADPFMRLVGLLHDVGKAVTLADGHFYGHETVGAEMVEKIMRRLRLPRSQVVRAVRLVRHHMFSYAPAWTDAAVRRFIRRVGAGSLPELFELRSADNAASGAIEPPTGGLDELRARVAVELASHPLSERDLAIRGDDLAESLGVSTGPIIGRLLHRLLEAVIEDPTRNERRTLLSLAAGWLPMEREAIRRTGASGARTHHRALEPDENETPDGGGAG